MRLLFEILFTVGVGCLFVGLAVLFGAGLHNFLGFEKVYALGGGMCIVSMLLCGIWSLNED